MLQLSTGKDGLFMKILKEGKNSLIISLSGEIDQYAAAELKECIDIEIQSTSRKNIIIDLGMVDMMDSSGIGLIVGRYKLTISTGKKFAICNASSSVKRMIELSGITKVISYYNTLTEAEKKMGF